MHTIRPPASELAYCKVMLADARVWLCEMLLWIAALLGENRLGQALRAELRREARACARGIRAALFLMALTQIGEPPCVTRPHHMARNHRRGSWLRHLTRRVKLRGRDLRGHFARLRDVIDSVDACVAKIAKRIARWMRRLAPLVRVSHRPCASVARVACDFSDSS
jgi:hypothetical protein